MSRWVGTNRQFSENPAWIPWLLRSSGTSTANSRTLRPAVSQTATRKAAVVISVRLSLPKPSNRPVTAGVPAVRARARSHNSTAAAVSTASSSLPSGDTATARACQWPRAWPSHTSQTRVVPSLRWVTTMLPAAAMAVRASVHPPGR